MLPSSSALLDSSLELLDTSCNSLKLLIFIMSCDFWTGSSFYFGASSCLDCVCVFSQVFSLGKTYYFSFSISGLSSIKFKQTIGSSFCILGGPLILS
jgi:hypothetical protein